MEVALTKEQLEQALEKMKREEEEEEESDDA